MDLKRRKINASEEEKDVGHEENLWSQEREGSIPQDGNIRKKEKENC